MRLEAYENGCQSSHSIEARQEIIFELNSGDPKEEANKFAFG